MEKKFYIELNIYIFTEKNFFNREKHKWTSFQKYIFTQKMFVLLCYK